MSKKNIVIILFTFLGVNTAYTQATKTTNSTEFLASVISNLESAPGAPVTQVSDFQFLRPRGIDEVQFRTETDEWDFNRQRYTLRVSHANRKIQRLEREIYRKELQEKKVSSVVSIEDLLKDAYEFWVTYALCDQEIALHDKLLSIQRDRLKVLERKLLLPKFDAVDLLEEEDDYNNTQMDIKELEAEQLFSASKIDEIVVEKLKTYDTSDLISLETIKELLAQEYEYNAEQHPDYATLEARKELILAELNLEQAEKNNIFDFAQIEYRGPHEELLRERVSIGFGFRFTTKSNIAKINELELENIEREHRFEQDIAERLTRSKTAKTEVLLLIAQYDDLVEQAENAKYSHQKIADRYAQSANTSPLLLLKIKELEEDKKIKQVRLKKDIYEAFLDWLFWSGKMMEQPYRNYLSSNMNVVKS